MNAVVAAGPQPEQSAAIMERVLLAGDLSKLSNSDRLFYYSHVCESVGLNPLTRPFDYLQLNGKLTLYAKRDATDQLRKIHGVSIVISGRQTIEGVHIVTARAKDKTGREDESTGAVTITNLKGDALANALMKAETKAKRRVTLSICGLGMLDETEIETIPASACMDASRDNSAPPKQPEPIEADTSIVSNGKHKGKPWSEISEQYLDWATASESAPAALKAGANAERQRRAKAFAAQIQGDESIPH